MRFPEPSDEWACPLCGVKGRRSEGEYFISHRETEHGGISSLASLDGVNDNADG